MDSKKEVQHNRRYLSRYAAHIDFATKGKYFCGIIKRIVERRSKIVQMSKYMKKMILKHRGGI